MQTCRWSCLRFVTNALLIPFVAVSLNAFLWWMFERAIYYGDAGLTPPRWEAIAMTILFSPINALRAVLPVDLYAGYDDEALKIELGLTAVFWTSVLYSLTCVAAWGVGRIRRRPC